VILEDYLEINAKRYPQKTAVVCGEEVYTYEALYERVLVRTEALKALYQTGQIVALRAYPTVAYLVEYFALHMAGCVAAPLERDMPEATFQEIALWLEANTTPEGTADILYTTGTTGRSKGVMISHRTIIADAENLIDGQGFTHELAFVVNGPLNHIGSLSKIYPVVVLGATLIIVDGLKDLNKFFAAFDYPVKKMATFLVPASIRMLIQFSGKQLARYADKIDFIETGAAAISQADMEALCQLLPKTRLYNTYASTETGIIATYNYNGGKCVAGCLGRTMKHSKLIITKGGLIACQGDTLMSGYVGDPERTASILRGDTVYTSDIGMIDEDGLLHLKGREDDVINVGGFKVAPTEVEDAAMSYPRLKDCICIAIEHPITGRALKLLVVMSDGEQLNKRELALHLKGRLEAYKVPMLYEQVEKVARTFNGKLDRKRYALNIKD
jgi:acyl-CoA synthetase (AMP-forming)/AMP-acid ligase II